MSLTRNILRLKLEMKNPIYPKKTITVSQNDVNSPVLIPTYTVDGQERDFYSNSNMDQIALLYKDPDGVSGKITCNYNSDTYGKGFILPNQKLGKYECLVQLGYKETGKAFNTEMFYIIVV